MRPSGISEVRSVTSATPVVRVPVLSKEKLFTSAKASSAAPPLNNTPPRAAAASADSMAAGTEITTAQGLAATNSTAAR